MHDKKLLSALKNLASCDKKITEKKEVLSHKKKSLEQLIQSVETLASERSLKKKSCDDLQKEFQELRLSREEALQHEQRKRERLETISSPKEYRALERELELLSKKSREVEQRAQQLAGVCKKNKEEVDFLLLREEQLQAETAIQKKNYEEEMHGLNKEIELLLQERTVLICLVPLEWQGRYEKMRLHVEDPVVPVLNTVCSSCYYVVLPHDLGQLKKHALISCKNCYRILYAEADNDDLQPMFS